MSWLTFVYYLVVSHLITLELSAHAAREEVVEGAFQSGVRLQETAVGRVRLDALQAAKQVRHFEFPYKNGNILQTCHNSTNFASFLWLSEDKRYRQGNGHVS